jgi:hypothetical protein
MIELELAALADRVAPPDRPDLPERVLARIDGLDVGADTDADLDRGPKRTRALVAVGVAALVATSFLSAHVRAFAADLLDVAGIEFSTDTPDAPPVPVAPLPDSRETSVAEAQEQVDFPIRVPARLGPPDEVVVVDGGRVVSMSWRDGSVLLDQFEGHPGPVFTKTVRFKPTEIVRIQGAQGWWIGKPHDLTYVTEEGREFTATARLAGRTLVWESGSGVTFRLEVEQLDKAGAAAIARSLR